MGDVVHIGEPLTFKEKTVLSSLPSNRWVDRATLSDWHGFDVRKTLNDLFDRGLVQRAGSTWRRR